MRSGIYQHRKRQCLDVVMLPNYALSKSSLVFPPLTGSSLAEEIIRVQIRSQPPMFVENAFSECNITKDVNPSRFQA